MDTIAASFLPPFTKKHIVVFGLLTLLVASLFLLLLKQSTNNSNTPTQTVTKTASVESLKQDFKDPLATAQTGAVNTAWIRDDFLILDVRKPERYAAGHIKGSLSAPAAGVEKGIYGSEDEIVVYSDNAQEITQATEALKAMNVKAVHTLNATIDSLRQGDYTIVSSEQESVQ
jgi:rhodanese-related sulfurtransferase